MRKILPLLIVSILTFLANPAAAQTFTVLHAFANTNDGSYPSDGVVLSANGVLYGTTYYSLETWSINTNGTGFTVLTNVGSFASPIVLSPPLIYEIGLGDPLGYNGELCSLNTNGTSLTNLLPSSVSSAYAFTLVGNTIYGLCTSTNINSGGALYSVYTNGANFKYLYNFTTNDGSIRAGYAGNVIVGDGRIYISTSLGVQSPGGSVFSVDTNGLNYNLIYQFTNANNGCGGPAPVICVLTNDTLYGLWQGLSGCDGPNDPYIDGAVFALSANASFTNGYITNGYYTNIYEFNGYNGSSPTSLILSGDTLYGAAEYGFGDGFTGSSGLLFSIKTNGFDYRTLLQPMPDGANPMGPIVLAGNTIYGTEHTGGGGGWGVVYSFVPLPEAPVLAVSVAPTNDVVLSWLTNYQNFQLEFTTNLTPPVVWYPDTNEPVIVSNLFEVTNEMSFGTNITFYNWATNSGGGLGPPGGTNSSSTNGVYSIPGQGYYRLAYQTNSP